jgi:hypothetical protein
MATHAGNNLGGVPQLKGVHLQVVMYIDQEMPCLHRSGTSDIIKIASCMFDKKWGKNPANKQVIATYQMFIDGTQKSCPDVEDFIENNPPLCTEVVIQARTQNILGLAGSAPAWATMEPAVSSTVNHIEYDEEHGGLPTVDAPAVAPTAPATSATQTCPTSLPPA